MYDGYIYGFIVVFIFIAVFMIFAKMWIKKEKRKKQDDPFYFDMLYLGRNEFDSVIKILKTGYILVLQRENPPYTIRYE